MNFGLKTRNPKPDTIIAVAIFFAALAAYFRTLAPTVLDGDAALFQFTPSVMGVTYPTGYPVYLLVARIWLAIFPIGEIAWRMNLFSAVCAALAMAIFYRVAQNILRYRLAAVSSVLLFASLPTFWRWATEAKIYTLNILLFTTALYFLTRPKTPKIEPRRSIFAALVAGLQLGVHSTTVLLLPGMVWMMWKNYRPQLKQMIILLMVLVAPMALYLYVPVRGEMLIAQMGRTAAIRHGLLADFYHSGFSGWVRYFTAADFTGGVVTNWARVPHDFFAVYLGRLMRIDWGWLGVFWGFAGLAVFAVWQPLRRWTIPLVLLFALPIPFVLTYGRGEQNAFLLTSNLVFALFAGGVVALITNHESRITNLLLRNGLWGLTMAAVLILPIQHARSNFDWLTHKWGTANHDYWLDVLTHPLESDAGIMATWGDLTSMWYMQHIRHLRPDIAGLYPPTETIAADWLAQGRSLYVAGPVFDEWSADELSRYQLLPWGRLVRLLPKNAEIPTLHLPRSVNAVFDGKLALSGVDFPHKIPSGGRMTVQLAWQSLAELPENTYYSLRLSAADGTIVAQKDDVIRPGWYPAPAIPAELPMLGAYSLAVPTGTLPGKYRLQLAVYNRSGQEWVLTDGERVLDLGGVTVQFSPATGIAGWRRFGGEIALDALEFGVTRVRQGKGYPVQFLWRALKPPTENYTLLVELVDCDGRVWRDWRISVETAAWRENQQVRQQVDVVVPAEAPTGAGALSVRVRWLRADGTALSARRWILPAGDGFSLAAPTVLPKDHRQFERPAIAGKLVDVNFGDKLALVGFELPSGVSAGAENLPVTLYWQGRGDMREVYSVFVHIVDAAGNVVAQHDGIPADGTEPTTAWAIGEYITDPLQISLPPDLSPGEYSVVVGVYLPATGTRLPILKEHSPVGDSFTLGMINVDSE